MKAWIKQLIISKIFRILNTNLKKIKTICCIGAGYVGGPTMGFGQIVSHINVYVVDKNKDRIKRGIQRILMICLFMNLN